MKRSRAAEADAGPSEQSRFSRLDQATLDYYREIGECLHRLDGGEEKTLLADNTLAETHGREAQIAPDAACSRVLETALTHASASSIATFLNGCIMEDNLGIICTSGPFGSHVLEKSLLALANVAAIADEEGFAVLEGALLRFTEAAAASLYDMISSKYGSFVARRLLCVLSGVDVLTPPSRKRTPGDTDGNIGDHPSRGKALPYKPTGFSARVTLGNNKPGNVSSGAFLGMLTKIVEVVTSDEWRGEELRELQSGQYSGPFLQSLMRAVESDESQSRKVIIHLLGGSAGLGPSSINGDEAHRLLMDQSGSHLVETALETAPDDVFQTLCSTAFKGRIVAMAQHKFANFAVQSALAKVKRAPQLKRMFDDLRPALGGLLRSRRPGVVVMLLAACLRLETCLLDVAEAVWHAVGAGVGASEGSTPLHRILTMDTNVVIGDKVYSGRLSPLGCSALITLMKFPPEAAKHWVEALRAMSREELGFLARDPGGCRVLESFLQGPSGAPKKRRQMMQALEGSWPAAASTGAGCRFIEFCYDLADSENKQSIVSDIARAEDRLATTVHGARLLRYCQVHAFKAGAGEWERRIHAAENVKKEFKELFGGVATAEERHEGGISKGPKNKEKTKGKKAKKLLSE